MKKAFLSLITLLACCLGHAQTNVEETLPADRNHWTISVGCDVSIPGNWKVDDTSFKMFKPGSGVSIGADYLVLFAGNFFFESGIRLYYDTYRYDNIAVGGDDMDDAPKTIDPPVRKTGLRIPLTAGYKFDIFKSGSLLLSTGPEASFGFSATSKLDEGLDETHDENMYKSLMRRCDVAWDVRAAVIIDRVRVDLTGSFGMLDMLKNAPKMHEYRLSLSLGYIF